MSSDPPRERGTMWCTSTACSKPQRMQRSPYLRFARVRQWLAGLLLPEIFRLRPTLPHSGEQYWSGRLLTAFGSASTDLPHVAQGTMTRLYDGFWAPLRLALCASRQAAEQYRRRPTAANVPAKASPQCTHLRSTRGFLRFRELWPLMYWRPSAAWLPQPHLHSPMPKRPERPYVLPFRLHGLCP